MKRPVFIARQSASPSGLMGRVIAGIMAHETSDLNEHALRLLRPSPSDLVLEVGFGHGRTIERLASVVNTGRVCGIDVSESMLNMAVRRNRRAIAEGRVELRKGDCASIPFDAASFDGALSFHTLYFWSDPAGCLREIRRVLRPGARTRSRLSARRQRPTKQLPDGGLHILRRTPFTRRWQLPILVRYNSRGLAKPLLLSRLHPKFEPRNETNRVEPGRPPRRRHPRERSFLEGVRLVGGALVVSPLESEVPDAAEADRADGSDQLQTLERGKVIFWPRRMKGGSPWNLTFTFRPT